MGPTVNHVYEFGPFRVDAEERLLLREGSAVPLPPKALETLLVLVQNGGRALGKDELMKALWPDTFVEEGSLAHNISILRKALGDTSGEPRYIQTLPRRGYRFMAAVNEVCEPQPSPSQPDAVVEPVTGPVAIYPPRAARPGRRWAVLLTCAVVISAGVAGIHLWVSGPPGRTAKGDEPRSVAVLPFINLSADAEDEYFADGLTDEMISALTRVEGLRVVARTSSFQFKDRAADVREIGKRLNADTLLEGSVSNENGRLRIRAQLIRVSDGYHLWSETFDRQAEDLLATQEEISQAIVSTMLLASRRSQLVRKHSRNPEAYQLYLKGLYFLNKASEEALQKAKQSFEQAIVKDADYALAYTGLADSYLVAAGYHYLPAEEAIRKARAAAVRAIQLDDSLAESHCSLALVRARERDWDEAGREFRRALELNPGDAGARHAYATAYLVPQLRLDDALAELEHAESLDPVSAYIGVSISTVYRWKQQYDRAVDYALKVLELEPAHWPAHMALGLAYEDQKQLDRAVASFQKAEVLSKGNPIALAALGHCYATQGRRPEARVILQKLQEPPHRGHYETAWVLAGLGEYEQALDWLEKARQQGSIACIGLNVDLRWDRLRSHPRFQAILKKSGLPN